MNNINKFFQIIYNLINLNNNINKNNILIY